MADEQATSTVPVIYQPVHMLLAVRDNPAILTTLTNTALRDFLSDTLEALTEIKAIGQTVTSAALDEFGKRMRADNARAIPDAVYTIALEQLFTEYEYDIDSLVQAATMLPPKEAAKVVRYVPEETIPAHYEPGHPRSIATLAEKYGDQPVGKLLKAGMQRKPLGEKVVFKKNETATERHAA